MIDYGIQYEKKFIDGIGTGKFYDWKDSKIHPTRLDLLKAYKRTLSKRTKWDSVDKDIINAYVGSAIFKEKGAAV